MSTIALLAGICLLIATPAYAYVDPGAGSMLVQLLTGGVAGALVLVRLFWSRLRGKAVKTPDAATDPSPQPEDSASPQAR